jgi:hypothetical protein
MVFGRGVGRLKVGDYCLQKGKGERGKDDEDKRRGGGGDKSLPSGRSVQRLVAGGI